MTADLEEHPSRQTRSLSGRLKTRSVEGQMNRRRKFNNVPTVVDGVTFDSKKEARRWGELLALHKAGRITALRRQVRIPIRLNEVIVARYFADFVYIADGQRVIEDVKSPITRMDPVYRLKRRMLAAMGVQIREV